MRPKSFPSSRAMEPRRPSRSVFAELQRPPRTRMAKTPPGFARPVWTSTTARPQALVRGEMGLGVADGTGDGAI